MSSFCGPHNYSGFWTLLSVKGDFGRAYFSQKLGRIKMELKMVMPSSHSNIANFLIVILLTACCKSLCGTVPLIPVEKRIHNIAFSNPRSNFSDTIFRTKSFWDKWLLPKMRKDSFLLLLLSFVGRSDFWLVFEHFFVRKGFFNCMCQFLFSNLFVNRT
jgi:hypothetical protein